MIEHVLAELWQAGDPVLLVTGLKSGPLWARHVKPGDARRGPWRRAEYRVLDQVAWDRPGHAIYFVRGNDGGFRYTGIARKSTKFKQRWRLAVAVDPNTGARLGHELFHSQCWKPMQAELEGGAGGPFEIRVLSERAAQGVVKGFGRSETDVVGLEAWLRSGRSGEVLPWNKV